MWTLTGRTTAIGLGGIMARRYIVLVNRTPCSRKH
jgi:hypothetical protein